MMARRSPGITWALRIATGLCLATASYAAPAADGEVSLSIGGMAGAEAGSTVTVAFIVENRGLEDRRVEPTAKLPAGWHLAVPLAPFLVQGGERVTRLLTARVPRSAPAGEYVIELKIRTDSGTEVSGDVPIRVSPRFGLSLERLEAPRVVADGRPFVVRFRLVNHGNTSDEVSIRTQADAGFSTAASDGSVVLVAGGAHDIEVTIRPGAPLAQSQDVMVHISAIAADDGERRARATAFVHVVPVGGPQHTGATSPGSVRLAGAGAGGAFASQVAFAASELGPGGPLSLDVRLPQMGGSSLNRFQDHFSLDYRGSQVTALLGDRVFGLSPLLRAGHQSFGAHFSAHEGNFGAAGYVSRSRYGWSDETRQAANVHFGTEDNFIATGFLRVRDGQGGDAFSLRSVLTPLPSTNLDVELAGGTDRAARIAAVGQYDRGGFHMEWMSAGGDFPGPQRGQEHRFARVNFRPMAAVSVDGHYSHIQHSTGPDSRQRSMRTMRLSTRVDAATLLRGSAVRLAYSTHERHFGVVTPLSLSESSLETGMILSRPRFFASTTVRLGTLNRDDTGEGAVQVGRVSVQGSFNGGPIAANGSIEVDAGPSLDHPYASFGSRGSFSVQYSILPQVRVDGSVSVNHVRSDGQNLLHASRSFQVRAQLPIGGTLTMGVSNRRFDMFNPQGGVEYSLTYDMPFGIPRSGVPHGPTVRGQVVDLTGTPLPGIVVTVGETSALTDDQGSFELATSDTEERSLYIDRLSLGLDRIPLVEMPIRIPPGTHDELILIPVAPSASLHGRVESEDLASSQMPRLIIEATDGAARLRTATDAVGGFAFHDLRPGNWEVRIIGGQVGDRLSIDEEVQIVELEGGSRGEVQFHIRERDRIVRIIDRGTVSRR